MRSNPAAGPVRRRLPAMLIGAAALACAASAPSAFAQEPVVSYALAGVVHVHAAENAVSEMLIGLYGRVDVAADGTVTGEGVAIYDWMEACSWTPPYPDNAPPPYCRIDGVTDARFTITGRVAEYVHRRDDDNPLKDGVFALADAMAPARLDYAPLRLELTLALDGALTEQLAFWGFSQPEVQWHDTQAATLGVLVSGLFGAPFEIAPIAAVPVEDTAQGRAVVAARQFSAEGRYDGGTPVGAAGSVGFVPLDPATLPTAANPWTYLQHWVEGPEVREFSAEELAAIEAYESGTPPEPHVVDREILAGGMTELVEALLPFAEGTAFDAGGPGYSPYTLVDRPAAE